MNRNQLIAIVVGGTVISLAAMVFPLVGIIACTASLFMQTDAGQKIAAVMGIAAYTVALTAFPFVGIAFALVNLAGLFLIVLPSIPSKAEQAFDAKCRKLLGPGTYKA